MKVICIEKMAHNFVHGLTIGKWYELISTPRKNSLSYFVKDDVCRNLTYPKWILHTEQQERDKKLKDILQ